MRDIRVGGGIRALRACAASGDSFHRIGAGGAGKRLRGGCGERVGVRNDGSSVQVFFT
jgi:hypothetical protein